MADTQRTSVFALCLLFCLLLLRPSIASRPVPAPRILALVPSAPLILSYHDGPLLTRSLQLHLLWYGSFAASQQAIVSDFISSFQGPTTDDSVAGWWSTAHSYKDSSSAGVASRITLGQISSDSSYSIGKNLTKSDIDKLVESSLATHVFPSDPDAVIVVLTADDVLVEDFCMNSCGFHSSTSASSSSSSLTKQPYIWVGNAAKQCPGFCAWPYAVPEFGPPNAPLVSPNGDAGMDGMVINIATLLAGTATNPFNTGYFQGDATDPLEAVTACAGIFGKNSYPGYAGDLLEDKASKASYNALGVNNRMFLLPAMWSPSTLECKTLV